MEQHWNFKEITHNKKNWIKIEGQNSRAFLFPLLPKVEWQRPLCWIERMGYIWSMWHKCWGTLACRGRYTRARLLGFQFESKYRLGERCLWIWRWGFYRWTGESHFWCRESMALACGRGCKLRSRRWKGLNPAWGSGCYLRDSWKECPL